MRGGTYPFSLRQLQYAVAVADRLSFREAAATCYVSQPSLSAQIAQMEKILGVRLFERNKRRVLVTSIGATVIARARLILRMADDLVDEVHQTGDPFSGTLKIGIIPTLSPYLLPQLTRALHKAYPHLSIRWTEDKTRILVQHLESGVLDAALLALEADIGDLEREIIAEDEFVLVAPRGHVLAVDRARIGTRELRGQNLLVLEEEHCFGEQAATFCSRKNASVDAFRATSLTTLVQMAAGGMGATLLPELALPHEVKGTNLCIRFFAEPTPRRTIGLIWRRHYPFAASLRQLSTTIRAGYPKPPPRPWKRG